MIPELRDELVETLKAEIERLEDRVVSLENLLAPPEIMLPMEWGLTASEQKVFRALIARETASKDWLLMFLYEGRDEAAIKIVDVFICKIRKKLKPFNVEIFTRWGVGYGLAPGVRAQFKARLTERSAA